MADTRTPVNSALYDECYEKAELAFANNLIDITQILMYTMHLYESKGGKCANDQQRRSDT